MKTKKYYDIIYKIGSYLPPRTIFMIKERCARLVQTSLLMLYQLRESEVKRIYKFISPLATERVVRHNNKKRWKNEKEENQENV